MGQAKQRGTFEERRNNPQGYPQHVRREWTEEERAALVEAMRNQIDSIKKSLFSPIKRKKKRFARIKTGG
jgi:hypothetical protein